MTGRAKQRLMRPVERQPMRQWLSDRLNSKEIPGLEWVNKEQRIFRIKWCHGSRHGWSLKDSVLFEKWAQHSGRYNEGDPKRWKANFRCALNSLKDVQEVKDLSISKGQNAFRVYRMFENRKKTDKPNITKRVKVEPDTNYISNDTTCVLKDALMNVRSSARLASQKMPIKVQAESTSESSESESEGYQTDVQEDHYMDSAVNEPGTLPYRPDTDVTKIKTETFDPDSRIPNFNKIIPNFYRLEFDKEHVIPRHGSGFKVTQLQQQKPLIPILNAFNVPLPQDKAKSRHSLKTNHPDCLLRNAELTLKSDSEVSSISSTKQTTKQTTSPAFHTPTTNQRYINSHSTFPDTPDGSDISNDDNSNEYIEVTIYEEEVGNTVSGESTEGCIVLTDLSRSCVSNASLTSHVHAFEDSDVNYRESQTDGSTVSYTYNPLTPP